MMDYKEILDKIFETFMDRDSQVLSTLITLFILFIVSKLLQKALLYRITKLVDRHKVRRSITWATFLAFVFVSVIIWAPDTSNLGVFLGIIGAGVALSMQELLLCLAGWGMLVFKKPFDVGDRIEVQSLIGDVIDIGIFNTSLLEVGNWVGGEQSTGRLMVLPNSIFIRQGIHNYTKGFPFVWNEIPIIVTFESDWREAKKILLEESAQESDKTEELVNSQILSMQKDYAIHYESLTPTVYTDIDASGVRLTLRYLTPVQQRRTTNHRISENVLDNIIKNPNVDFAYPTTRIYRNSEEGKAALKSGL